MWIQSLKQSLHSDILYRHRERETCTKQKNQCHLLKENVDDCLSTGLPTPDWAWSLWTKQWKQCILERPGQQILETWHIKKWRSSFVQLNLLTTSVHTWQMLIAVELWGGFSKGSWRQRMLIAVLSLVNWKMLAPLDLHFHMSLQLHFGQGMLTLLSGSITKPLTSLLQKRQE